MAGESASEDAVTDTLAFLHGFIQIYLMAVLCTEKLQLDIKSNSYFIITVALFLKQELEWLSFK